jgi:hypothetical protein
LQDGGAYTSQNAYQRARKFFSCALKQLAKVQPPRLSPSSVRGLSFFQLARCVQKRSRRAGVLAHAPLSPPRARPARLFPSPLELLARRPEAEREISITKKK